MEVTPELLEARWQEYLAKLIGKYERGEITADRYIQLTDSLIAWVNLANERGLV